MPTGERTCGRLPITSIFQKLVIALDGDGLGFEGGGGGAGLPTDWQEGIEGEDLARVAMSRHS